MTRPPSYLDDPSPTPNSRKSEAVEDHVGISSLSLILLTIAAIGVLFGLCLLLVAPVIRGAKDHIIDTEKRILYATDPAALLTGCRQLAATSAAKNPLEHSAESNVESNVENSAENSANGTQIDPNSPIVPSILHRVDPKQITIAGERVTLECGGGSHLYGVVADIGSGDPSTQPSPPMTVRQLAPGLWFYAEDGYAPPP